MPLVTMPPCKTCAKTHAKTHVCSDEFIEDNKPEDNKPVSSDGDFIDESVHCF
jgi:hypothetical protein